MFILLRVPFGEKMRPCATGYRDEYGIYRSHVHDATCSIEQARAGAYWLGMLGFAIAVPCALEWAANLSDKVPDYPSLNAQWMACAIRGGR